MKCHGLNDFMSCFDTMAIAHEEWNKESDDVQVAFHTLRAELLEKAEQGKFASQKELEKAIVFRKKLSHPRAPGHASAFLYFLADRCV